MQRKYHGEKGCVRVRGEFERREDTGWKAAGRREPILAGHAKEMEGYYCEVGRLTEEV